MMMTVHVICEDLLRAIWLLSVEVISLILLIEFLRVVKLLEILVDMKASWAHVLIFIFF